jgi:hypothetical protein
MATQAGIRIIQQAQKLITEQGFTTVNNQALQAPRKLHKGSIIKEEQVTYSTDYVDWVKQTIPDVGYSTTALTDSQHQIVWRPVRFNVNTIEEAWIVLTIENTHATDAVTLHPVWIMKDLLTVKLNGKIIQQNLAEEDFWKEWLGPYWDYNEKRVWEDRFGYKEKNGTTDYSIAHGAKVERWIPLTQMILDLCSFSPETFDDNFEITWQMPLGGCVKSGTGTPTLNACQLWYKEKKLLDNERVALKEWHFRLGGKMYPYTEMLLEFTKQEWTGQSLVVGTNDLLMNQIRGFVPFFILQIRSSKTLSNFDTCIALHNESLLDVGYVDLLDNHGQSIFKEPKSLLEVYKYDLIEKFPEFFRDQSTGGWFTASQRPYIWCICADPVNAIGLRSNTGGFVFTGEQTFRLITPSATTFTAGSYDVVLWAPVYRYAQFTLDTKGKAKFDSVYDVVPTVPVSLY